jgi:hypothetical protein
MNRTILLLKVAAALSLVAAGGTMAQAQFPKLPDISPPSLPNIPTPNLPKPKIPNPTVPKPPKIPTPKIPDPAAEVKKQAARIDELRRKAERVIKDFKRMKEEAEKTQREYDRLSKLARSGKLDAGQEAYRALASAGVLQTNQERVKKSLDDGLGLIIWGKEFDHFEEQQLAAALAASVASGNPGPAMVYVKKFALESKAEVMRSLQSAPVRLRKKVEAEFEMFLIRGLEAIIKGQRPPSFAIDGVDVRLGLATYNHHVAIRTSVPRLVETEKILGVQLYRIATDAQTITVPLPNTFQPYFKVAVRRR